MVYLCYSKHIYIYIYVYIYIYIYMVVRRWAAQGGHKLRPPLGVAQAHLAQAQAAQGHWHKVKAGASKLQSVPSFQWWRSIVFYWSNLLFSELWTIPATQKRCRRLRKWTFGVANHCRRLTTEMQSAADILQIQKFAMQSDRDIPQIQKSEMNSA